MTDEKGSRVVTIRLVGIVSGVITAVAASILVLGQFAYMTRTEGARILTIIEGMKLDQGRQRDILDRLDEESRGRIGVIATLVERQETSGRILEAVAAELKEMRSRGPGK